jgi:phosphoribosylamine--glycine ligase
LDGGRVVTAGGRVLGVTGRGTTLREAQERAYRAAGRIRFDGMQLRRDIGAGAFGPPPPTR